MGDKNTITLPDATAMLARLIAASDINHYRERFYPLLLKHAGKTMKPDGVVTAFVLAIETYAAELPPMIRFLIYRQADTFIDALIVDNAVAATEAKQILAEVLAKARQK